MASVTIEILHNRDCHVWKILRDELRRWLRTWGLADKAKVKTVLIDTEEAAHRRRFFGSPQVLIDGCDIDPAAEKASAYHTEGCRLYVWKNKIYEYPSREMLEEAILRVPELCNPQKSEKSK